MGHGNSKHKQGATQYVTHHGVSLHLQFGDSPVPVLRTLTPFFPAQTINPTDGSEQDAETTRRTAGLTAGDAGVSSLAVSPTWRDSDRQYSLATGSGDSSIRLYCSTTERNYLTLWHGRRSSCAVRCVAFSPDGTHLASGASDSTVRVWRLPSDLSRTYVCTPAESRRTFCVARLLGHSEGIWGVAYSPMGGLLASAAADGLVLVWKMQPGRSGAPSQHLLDSMRQAHEQSAMLSASEDGNGSAAGDDRLGSASTVPGEAEYVPLAGSQGVLKTVCFSPSGKCVASGGMDTVVRIWCPVTGRSRMELRGHTGAVTCVSYTPDGTILASGSIDDTVLLWAAACTDGSPREGAAPVHCAPLRKLHGASGSGPSGIMAMAFSKAGGGNMLAVVCANRETKVWAVVPRNDDVDPEPFVLSGAHRDYTFAVVFSPHGSSVITGSRDRSAVVWRRKPKSAEATRDGAPTEWSLNNSVRRPLHPSCTPSAMTSPQAGPTPRGPEGTPQPLGCSASDEFGNSHTSHSAINPANSNTNGATAANRKSPDASPATPTKTKPMHEYAVRCAAFSPDGSHVVSVSEDAACVWACGNVGASPQLVCSETRLGMPDVAAGFHTGPSLVFVERWAVKKPGSRVPVSVEWLPGLAEAAFVPPQPLILFADGTRAAINFRAD